MKHFNQIIRLLSVLFLTVGIGYTSKAQSPLCASTSTNFGYEYMANITLNGQYYQGNTGYTGPGFYDYTGNPVPTLTAGQQITLSFTAQTKGAYQQYFKLWIDFNGNGNLNDPGELVYQHTDVWTGTRNFNSTFTVPTTVFNGEVYMRFIMVFSSSPVLCGNYSYGNTFDFKTTITGAVDPFNLNGNIYGGNAEPLPNVPLKLYKSVKGNNSFSLHGSYTTDVNGRYEITTSLDANSYDFNLEIGPITNPTPTTQDAQFFTTKVLSQNFNATDFYRMDVNNDNNLSISDVFGIYYRSSAGTWKINPSWSYRIFNQSEWNTINSSVNNLKTILPGLQTMTLNNVSTGSNNNFYIIRTGLKN